MNSGILYLNTLTEDFVRLRLILRDGIITVSEEGSESAFPLAVARLEFRLTNESIQC